MPFSFSSLCLACSGSVSLELLFHRKPSLILYQVGRWAWRLQNRWRISRYITLVNLLASDRVERKPGESNDPDAVTADSVPMPEYLTWEDRSDSIAQRTTRLLSDTDVYDALVDEFALLKEKFARPGASQTAAAYIGNVVNESHNTIRRPHFLANTADRSKHRVAG